MVRKSHVDYLLLNILAITIISLAFHTKALRTGRYNFYKILLRWPESFCNTGNFTCERPISNFTIHGLWPMYWGDHSVPSYSTQNGCTRTIPRLPDEITRRLLVSILLDMDKYWPNVKYHRYFAQNEHFWQYEWEQHGMCFDQSNYPIYYFNTTLNLIRRFNLLDLLITGGIIPNSYHGYDVSSIADIVDNFLQVQVEIRCNEDDQGLIQLYEIAICHLRNDTLTPCPYRFTNCGESDHEEVRFPNPFRNI
ncbi:putative Ribonuclease 2 [Tripterygium wilfordii]|uniref:Putative Ribonuclease 2 n=1 Tax=Tripterygium wilfordii TaxID=458696 RepID=A0A7J7DRI1_TRIWF|nr:ribonuclease S-F11-like [Tripterygium wilfordii]KAF5748917.1 putative Ribonuclease 2 [Tripterygium wilfordii]